jgi:ABC-type branched-subunit amino acid transport system substrate-binding protein
MQIWAEEVNAKGGLLGRPVQIIYYDDQTNAANVPAIYAKLLDIDKVDLLVGHATNLIVAALPMIIERKKMVMTLLAYASNAKLKYPRYFQSAPFGGDYGEISKNFFEVAKTIKPEPKTVALVGADAEFSNNVLTGARTNAPKYNLKIVYDQLYPPSTLDYAPIVRALAATNPDIVLVASYPVDSVGMVRAATEIGLKTSLFGGAMVGMQYASFMGQLSEKLNRVVNYHLYVPSPKLSFPGIESFLKKYQERAPAPEPTRSVSTSHPSPTPRCRCSNKRSPRPAALTTTSSHSTSTRTRSRPSSEKSASTKAANGQRRGSSWYSFRTCAAAGWINISPADGRSSSIPHSTSRAICNIRSRNRSADRSASWSGSMSALGQKRTCAVH